VKSQQRPDQNKRRKVVWRWYALALQWAFISFSAFADDSENNQDMAKILHTGTKAVLIKVETPVYPPMALRRGIEGWVVIRLAVKADGTTDDIEVVATSIENYFDDAAVEATRARIYQPATLQGTPVMQRNILVRSTFQLKDSKGGVSKPFLKAYRKTKSAMENGDLELAKSLIDKLDGTESRLLAEVCYLDMLKSIYYAKKGNNRATLRYLEHALVIADNVASRDIYIGLLRQSIVINAKANNYQTSLKRYNTLLETDEGLTADDPIHNYVKRIREILNGEAAIQTMGKISLVCKTCETPVGFWRHVLNRNRFLIDQVVGELNEVEIVCQNSSISVAHNPETAWSVNKDGGECIIRVLGEEKTTFRLVELANEG
jgi:TonB family protein